MLSKILYCIIGFCAVTGHAQLTTTASPHEMTARQVVTPLVVKSYSTNVVNMVEPAITIVPASQPALSVQTSVRAPTPINSNVVKVPDETMSTVVTNNSQSANVINTGLAVVVAAPKIIGQKAVVQLKMKNNLADKVESARAVCFLLDDQGKMAGQATKWVIGGTKDRPALEPKGETTFNFVITSSQPFTTTNLIAKVSFNRVILENRQAADVNKTVTITPQTP